MKILLIIVSVLALTTVVYGFNAERLKTFYRNIEVCSEEQGKEVEDEHSVEVILCAAEKDGKILDANGEIIPAAAIQGIEDAISDANAKEKARQLYNKCHDEVEETGVTGKERTRKIFMCALPILNSMDKL